MAPTVVVEAVALVRLGTLVPPVVLLARLLVSLTVTVACMNVVLTVAVATAASAARAGLVPLIIVTHRFHSLSKYSKQCYNNIKK